MLEPIEIRLLGRFSVRRDGDEIPPGALGGRPGPRILRVLLTHRGGFVTHDVLAEALWPDGPPSDPAGNLKVLVARVRRGLGDSSLITTGSHLLLHLWGALGWYLATGRSRAALAQLRSAFEVWTGEPLPDESMRIGPSPIGAG